MSLWELLQMQIGWLKKEGHWDKANNRLKSAGVAAPTMDRLREVQRLQRELSGASAAAGQEVSSA